MLDLPDYMEAVASGIVLSVGGLTESVVKASQAALFDWIRGHNQAKNFGLLRRFAFFLVTLLTRHHQDDRVTIPLMKTIAVLLENNLLEFLFETNDDAASDKPSRKSSEFGSRLYDALRDEIQKCTAVPKLSAAISVLVGLLPSDNETENRVLKALLLFLAHRFPKVRKLTAERLYTRLLLDEEIIDEDKVLWRFVSAVDCWISHCLCPIVRLGARDLERDRMGRTGTHQQKDIDLGGDNSLTGRLAVDRSR